MYAMDMSMGCRGQNRVYGRQQRLQRIRIARRRKEVRRLRLFLAAGLILMVLSFSILSGFTHRGAEEEKYLYYTAVTVERDDTLYGIASRYVSTQNLSMNRYMQQIMDLNHMKSATVYYGQTLVVPYRSAELK